MSMLWVIVSSFVYDAKLLNFSHLPKHFVRDFGLSGHYDVAGQMCSSEEDCIKIILITKQDQISGCNFVGYCPQKAGLI